MDYFGRTRFAYLGTRLLNTPFWGIFSGLAVILTKELQITPFQVAIIVAMQPLSALIAPYWSLGVHGRSDRLVSNLVWANILKFVPFLFFPFITNTWLLILCCGLYWVLLKGAGPAWMEVIKRNVEGDLKERVVQSGSVIDHLGGGIMPVLFAGLLDHVEGSWRWIFFGTSVLGIASTLCLWKLRVAGAELIEGVKPSLVKPIQLAWQLLKRRPDFARFQLGYMLCGSALMMVFPILPTFYVQNLHLSYTEIAVAVALCKGIGFAVASPLWVKLFKKINLFALYSVVAALTVLFFGFLFGSSMSIALLYAAWLCYGIMQGGSELSWNMSGPVFAKEEDSAPYSSVNVLAVGVRGCIVPALGAWLLSVSSTSWVMAVAGFLCAVAAIFFTRKSAVAQLG